MQPILRWLIEELVRNVLTIGKAATLRNLKEIASAEAKLWGECFSAELRNGFLNCCSREEIAEVVRKVITEPYTYRNGWPDLTLISVEGDEIS